MGCDCAKPRDKDEPPKSPPPVQGYLNPALPAMRRKTVLLNGPQVSLSFRRVAEIGKLYRTESVVKIGETEAISLVEMVCTKKRCFLKRVVKAQGLEQIQQSAVLAAEMERLLRLDHPYVLHSYEAIQDEENFYLVSQPFLGGQLKELMRDKKMAGEQVCAQLMQQVFAALVYCHRQGVVHGRLSPYTIVFSEPFLSSLPRIKLTGFGSFDAIPCSPPPSDLSSYVSPEATQGYNEKSDIWSCGVVLYQLLGQELPFQRGKNAKVRTRRRSVTFASTNWDGKSREALDILSRMLDPNPHTRPTAAQCLDHPWIKQKVVLGTVKQSAMNLSVYCLRKMRGWNPLQLGVMKFVVHRLQEDRETDTATESFLMLDGDCDGVLTEPEVKRSFLKVFPEAEAFSAMKKVLEAMESNGGGVVSYSDFLVSFIGEKKLLSTGHLTMTFSFFDREKTGQVSLTDIKTALSGGNSAEKDRQWRELSLQANATPGGCIDFTEFSRLTGCSD